MKCPDCGHDFGDMLYINKLSLRVGDSKPFLVYPDPSLDGAFVVDGVNTASPSSLPAYWTEADYDADDIDLDFND